LLVSFHFLPFIASLERTRFARLEEAHHFLTGFYVISPREVRPRRAAPQAGKKILPSFIQQKLYIRGVISCVTYEYNLTL
jgi:hypothetical protein